MGSKSLCIGVGVLFLAGCPSSSGGGKNPPNPPNFLVGAAAPALPAPPPPPSDKLGLAYLEAAYPRIRTRWRAFINDSRLRLGADHPLNRRTLRAVVELKLRADGTSASTTLSVRSGNSDFDSAALEIARDAAPYPPSPQAIVSDDGFLHLSWAFHRDSRLAGVATAEIARQQWPPERAIPAFLAAGWFSRAAERLEATIAAPSSTSSDQLLELARRVAIAAIQSALSSGESDVLRAGIAAATRGKVSGATARLQAIARGGAEPPLQAEAIRALGALNARDSVPLLRDLMTSESASLQAEIAAARSLQQLGETKFVANELLRRFTGTGTNRQLALAVFAKVAVPAAIAPLTAAVTGSRNSARALGQGERSAACVGLGRAAVSGGDAAAVLKVLRGRLGARAAALRAACLRGVALLVRGRMGESNAATGTRVRSRATYWKVVELLKDRDERVRASAVLAASALEPKRFQGELYRLRRERSPLVLAAFADALGWVRGAQTLKRLVELSKSEDVNVRRSAARSLARRSEDEAKMVLTAMVSDADAAVKRIAMAASDVLDAQVNWNEAPLEFLAGFSRAVSAKGRAGTLELVAAAMVHISDVGDRAQVAGIWLAP